MEDFDNKSHYGSQRVKFLYKNSVTAEYSQHMYSEVIYSPVAHQNLVVNLHFVQPCSAVYCHTSLPNIHLFEGLSDWQTDLVVLP